MIHKVTEEVFFNHLLPQQTNSYIPVPNKLINNLIYQEAAERNYQITGRGFRANPSMTEFIAMFTLDKAEQGLSRMIGYRNSTNKKWAVGFVAGALVMICANGMICGDIITFRKHTGSVQEDLRIIVRKAFDEITPRFDSLKNDTRFLIEKMILRPVAMDIIADLFFTEKVLNVTQMSVLRDKLYLDPNFSIPSDPSVYFPAWSLYNQITEAMKHGAPGGYFQQLIDLNDYFQEKLERI